MTKEEILAQYKKTANNDISIMSTGSYVKYNDAAMAMQEYANQQKAELIEAFEEEIFLLQSTVNGRHERIEGMIHGLLFAINKSKEL